MKIGLAQVDCELGDVAANLEMVRGEAERAASEGCSLVVFPEMTDTGYEMATIEQLALPWSSGACAKVRSIAAELRIAIACGLSERDGDHVFNSMALIDSSGALVGHYRKTHLFSLEPVCEDRHMTAGDSIALVELGGLTLGLMICYDVRFPELARSLVLAGADVLLVSAAWPANRIEHWRAILKARAIENQVYVAAVNRAGVDGPLHFGGHSCLFDPWGKELGCADHCGAGVVFGDLVRDRIVEVRESMAVFADRRPGLYDCS